MVFESLLICSGVVVAYWISFACRNIPSDWSFRLPFLLQMAVSVSWLGWVATSGAHSRLNLTFSARCHPLLPVHHPPLLASMALLQGSKSRGTREFGQAAKAPCFRPSSSSGVDLDPSRWWVLPQHLKPSIC